MEQEFQTTHVYAAADWPGCRSLIEYYSLMDPICICLQSSLLLSPGQWSLAPGEYRGLLQWP